VYPEFCIKRSLPSRRRRSKGSGLNGTVENNIVFLRGFFEQLGFEYVSRLEHEFVSVSPPLEDARLEAVRAVGNFATCQLLKCTGDTVDEEKVSGLFFEKSPDTFS
jgi:hypothetical protein